MGIQIEWRLIPDPQHTGSAELRGPPGTPFLYVHPEDQAGQPRRSPSALWTYNHQDAAETSVIANAFTVTIRGYVSYARHMSLRAQYATAVNPPEPWRGQEAAKEVFTAAPVTGIQPSGQANYEAFLSFVPALPHPVKVTLTAVLRTRAFGLATRPGSIGMARSIMGFAKAFNDTVEITKVRSYVRIGGWPWIKRRSAAATYDVVVPAGGEIRIGEVNVGPAYEIRGGASLFTALSAITYFLGAVLPVEKGASGD